MSRITKIVELARARPYHGPYPFRGRSIAELDASLIQIELPAFGKYPPELMRLRRRTAEIMLTAFEHGLAAADGSPRIMVRGIEFSDIEVDRWIRELRRALEIDQ